MSSKIADAIQKTINEVPVLAKTERNAFAKYNFVGIDRFYETIPKIAVKYGLSWWLSTDEVAQVGDNTLMFKFSVHMAHVDGDIIHDFAKVTVPHPLQGAQTAGSAASYAEKIFMRTAFKVQTGEDDADATDPKETSLSKKGSTEPQRKVRTANSGPETVVPATSTKAAKDPFDLSDTSDIDHIERMNADAKPVFRKPTAGNWGIVATAFQEFIPLCTDLSTLKSFYDDNLGVLEAMKAEAGATHKEVLALFTKTKQALKDK